MFKDKGRWKANHLPQYRFLLFPAASNNGLGQDKPRLFTNWGMFAPPCTGIFYSIYKLSQTSQVRTMKLWLVVCSLQSRAS